MDTSSFLRIVLSVFLLFPFLSQAEEASAEESPTEAVVTEGAPSEDPTVDEAPPAVGPVALFAQEEPVPFDEAGTIMLLDPNLRIRYGLLPGIEGFVQALLFKKDSDYELAVTVEKEGVRSDTRLPLTVEQVAELREKLRPVTASEKAAPAPVTATPAPPPAAAAPMEKSSALEDEQAGFAPFLAYTTIWAGGYGAMMPFIFGGRDTHGAYYAGISLLSAGTAFTVGYFLGNDAQITRGMAFASGEGAFRGAADGTLLFWLIAGNYYNDETDHKTKTDLGMDVETFGRLMLASTMLFSMGEYALGMWYAHRYGLTGGEARMLGFGSLLGYAVTTELAATIFGGFFSEDPTLVRITPAMLLAGGIGGLFLGHAVNGWDRYTEGDVSLFMTTAVLGTYLPTSIALAAGGNDPRIYGGLALLGTIGGTIGGYYLLRGLDFSNLDAFIIDLGTLAGGLFTTGIAWLSTMETGQYQTIPVASSIGLIAGFGLMYYLYRDRGLRQAAREEKSAWRFQINPAGVATIVTGGRSPVPRTEEELRLLRESAAAPIASFEYRW